MSHLINSYRVSKFLVAIKYRETSYLRNASKQCEPYLWPINEWLIVDSIYVRPFVSWWSSPPVYNWSSHPPSLPRQLKVLPRFDSNRWCSLVCYARNVKFFCSFRVQGWLAGDSSNGSWCSQSKTHGLDAESPSASLGRRALWILYVYY